MGRNHEIRIKVNREEQEKIRKKAAQLGMNPSTFLRLLALKSSITIETEE